MNWKPIKTDPPPLATPIMVAWDFDERVLLYAVTFFGDDEILPWGRSDSGKTIHWTNDDKPTHWKPWPNFDPVSSASAYIKTFPEKIWLINGDLDKEPKSYDDECLNSEILWCEDEQFKFDVPYIRADLADSSNITKYVEQETQEICPNCESPLPEGCEGIFRDEPECKFNKVKNND